jgi:predicted CopG family antitoxin
MHKWEKLYSNLWIRVSDDNFEKLLQIQKDYQLKSVDDVLELLVNTKTISRLAKESSEYVSEKNVKSHSRAS